MGKLRHEVCLSHSARDRPKKGLQLAAPASTTTPLSPAPEPLAKAVAPTPKLPVTRGVCSA